jgi:5-formyltetrahydrofolate cyclo-ligase
MNSRAQIDRQQLRRELLARRSVLSPGFRIRAAHQVARLIGTSRWLQASTTIGLYVSMDTELDTLAVRKLAAVRNCRIFLPRISSYSARRMRMCADLGGILLPNRYGIAEPPATLSVATASLKVIFLPVVGFDAQGNRLGMGAGYYDRYLAGARPLTVGLAYECSRVSHLPALPHDIPLDAIVTEAGIEYFAQGYRH